MGSKLTTTHSSLCFLLIFAQCFGMLPVRGITNKDSNFLKFQWTSMRTLYSIIFIISATFNAVLFLMKMIRDQTTNFPDYVSFLFFSVTVITIILFIDVAKKWPFLMNKWTEVDKSMSAYEFPPLLRKKLKVVTVVIIGAAVVEHSLYISVEFISCGAEHNLGQTIERFLKFRYEFVFERIPYNVVLGSFLEILNIFSTLSWNFMDVFIMAISLCLSARFKQVGKYIKFLVENRVNDINIWERVRVDYTRLSVLSTSVDNVMSNIILVSFANNIFVILVQLFHTIQPPATIGAVDTIYYIYSFVFLIARMTAVAMYASTVHFESKKSKHYLGAVSAAGYNIEVERLLQQVKYNPAALSGHRIFRVTRDLILRITLAIVTYELVLVQFLTFN